MISLETILSMSGNTGDLGTLAQIVSSPYWTDLLKDPQVVKLLNDSNIIENYRNINDDQLKKAIALIKESGVPKDAASAKKIIDILSIS